MPRPAARPTPSKAVTNTATPLSTPVYDVAIIGGGLAGLSCALLLAKQDMQVICLDSEPLSHSKTPQYDARTTAISFGSRAVLRRAGIWADMEPHATGISHIDICDGYDRHTLTFDVRDIPPADAFGWIVNNHTLRQTLLAHIGQHKNITHITGVTATSVLAGDAHATITLDTGTAIRTRLVVGADGRRSFTRAHMGLGAWGGPYGQTALVCLVTHEIPHHGKALEHFWPEGPLALLPFANDTAGRPRSALVWTVPTAEAASWLAAPEADFLAAIEARVGSGYGRFVAATRREGWPLSLVKAYEYTAPRTLLLAEAAHGIHPIAGQGLNMSLRDIDGLAGLVLQHGREGLGTPVFLEGYQQMRRPDNLAMACATDLLNSLFEIELGPVVWLRRAGLRVVARLPFIKRFFMRQAMGQASAG